MHFTARSEKLLGKAALAHLAQCHVAVFGLGGVGSWAAEALARVGVGRLSLIDGDVVAVSNINRQLIADHESVGEEKTACMAARLRRINPAAKIEAFPQFYRAGDGAFLDQLAPDAILDAIDDVKAKLDLIASAHARQIPLLSATGCGRRYDPSALRIGDLFETSGDPLCRLLRRGLRERKIPALKVLYSTEPIWPDTGRTGPEDGPGSLPFVPPVAGLMLAAELVKELLEAAQLFPPQRPA